jgi:hypothetical protein
MRDRFRRFVAVLLVIFMIFQFPAGDGSGIGNEITQAFAATSAYNINLGTGVLQTGDGYQWSEAEGDTVYYGRGAAVANSGGMSYRVLKNNGSSMLLDCAQTYKYENHLSNYSEFGAWESSVPKEDMNSDIRSKLQLRDDEVSKLLNTVHPAENYTAEDGTVYTSPAGTDKVFMLSAEEIATYYADDSARAKGGAYWLRSTGSNKELADANTYVAADGQIMTTRSGSYAASPAFQIDSSISSVLFTSTADGKATGLQQPEQVTNQKWVLTLLTAGTLELADEEVSVEADPAGDTDQTKTPAVFWSSAVTVENFEVADNPCQYSVLITDRAYTAANAKIKWYGRLKEIEGGDAETIAFRLPSDYETTDHVYLLAEKDFKNSLAEIYLSHATKPLEIDLGISQVTVDSEDTHLVTDDPEVQTCYPKAGYHTSFQAMYTVEDGYYIPADYSVETQSGIQVKRLSSTKLQVSGTPTASAVTVSLGAAVKKGEQAAPKGLKSEYIAGGAAKIVGTTTKMEYIDEAVLGNDADVEWQECSDEETLVERGKTYLIRYKATSSKLSGVTARVEIKAAKLLTVKNPSDSHLVWDKTSGKEAQIVETGTALTDIVYKAEDGYYIPADYSLSTSGDVKVIRESADTIRIQAEQLSEDEEIVLDAASKQQAGSGSVAQANYYYGAAAPAPELKSETNGIENVIVEYKRVSEPDTSYVSAVPTQVGDYMIRATFPAVGAYMQVVAVSEFTIQYLPAPEHPYSVAGTQGENHYYISEVTVVPADGYLIADALDGEYQERLVLRQDTAAGMIYLKKQATGEKTDGIAMEAIMVDSSAPTITAVKDGATYYKDTIDVVVSDKHLNRIRLNDEIIEVKGTEMKLTLASNHGEEEYQIIATDEAGNETKIQITVAAPWLQKGIIPTGELIKLKSNQAYSFGDGTWQVSGDDTNYTGGRSFYVKKDGEYTFTKKK